MSGRRKKKMPLWEKLIIIGACIFVGIGTLLGVSSLFKEHALKNNVSNTNNYSSIIFVDENNNLLKSELVAENEMITVATIPNKKGHTFLGWNDGYKTYTTKELFTSYEVKYDTIFTPIYEVNIYEITFNNGEELIYKEVPFGSAIGEMPTIPEKQGYTSCWVDAEENVYTEESIYNIDEDLALTVKYIPYTYTINFYSPVTEEDLEGNNFEFVLKSTYTYDSEFIYPKLWFTYEGRNITWLFNEVEISEGTTNFFNVEEYPNNSSINLYAKWTNQTYQATYILNNGEENIISQIEYMADIQTPEVTKEGYVLRRWYYEEEILGSGDIISATDTYYLTSNSKYNFSKDMTFYAEWGEGIILNFDYNGAEVGIEEYSIYSGLEVATTVPTPGKAGYSFEGWYDAENDKLYSSWSSEITIHENPRTINLIAKWSEEKLTTVNLNYNGADGNNTITSISYYTGYDYYDLPIPTRTGYIFLGWGSGKTLDDLVVNEKYYNRTLNSTTSTAYAVWEEAKINTEVDKLIEAGYLVLDENGVLSPTDLFTSLDSGTLRISGHPEITTLSGFSSCTNITGLELSESYITTLADYAFQKEETIYTNVLNITFINFPSTIKTLGYCSLTNCPNITELILPEGLEDIGDMALAGIGVYELKLPSTLKRIGHNAFALSYNLKNIFIPNTVIEIGSCPFRDSTLECIYTEVQKKQTGWEDSFWNSNGQSIINTKYGYTYEQYLAEIGEE